MVSFGETRKRQWEEIQLGVFLLGYFFLGYFFRDVSFETLHSCVAVFHTLPHPYFSFCADGVFYSLWFMHIALFDKYFVLLDLTTWFRTTGFLYLCSLDPGLIFVHCPWYLLLCMYLIQGTLLCLFPPLACLWFLEF